MTNFALPTSNIQDIVQANPVGMVFAQRDPTVQDFGPPYPIGTEWQNKVTGDFWKLISFTPTVALWERFTHGGNGDIAEIITDNGTAIPVNNAITFTGSPTGLTTAASGSVMNLTGTLNIAHGGTNATSFSTTNGIVKFDGTSLVTSTTALINGSNFMTNTGQPCFSAYLSASTPNNVTGAGVGYLVICDTAFVNQSASYNTTTGVFTAPIEGNYLFTFCCELANLSPLHTSGACYLTTPAAGFQGQVVNPGAVRDSNNNMSFNVQQIAHMTVGLPMTFEVVVDAGTQTVGVAGGFDLGGRALTYISGALLN